MITVDGSLITHPTIFHDTKEPEKLIHYSISIPIDSRTRQSTNVNFQYLDWNTNPWYFL